MKTRQYERDGKYNCNWNTPAKASHNKSNIYYTNGIDAMYVQAKNELKHEFRCWKMQFSSWNARKRHTKIRSKYSSYKRIHVSNVILSISRKTERNTPIRKWHSSKAVSFESRCVCCFSVIFPPLFTICKVNLCTRNDFRFYIMHYLLCFGGFFATFIHRADYFPCRLVYTSKSV